MTRRTILIVEDEYFIADDCAQFVRAAGFDVAGPFGRIDEALLTQLDGIQGALLDINLAGECVYPLLDKLLSKNIPVTIYTGYEKHALPDKYAGLPIITKPSNCKEAIARLRQDL
jgi:DNA-binding response OmpR family regulator